MKTLSDSSPHPEQQTVPELWISCSPALEWLVSQSGRYFPAYWTSLILSRPSTRASLWDSTSSCSPWWYFKVQNKSITCRFIQHRLLSNVLSGSRGSQQTFEMPVLRFYANPGVRRCHPQPFPPLHPTSLPTIPLPLTSDICT